MVTGPTSPGNNRAINAKTTGRQVLTNFVTKFQATGDKVPRAVRATVRFRPADARLVRSRDKRDCR